MRQGPDGVPVAVPVQAGGGMIAMQPIGAQAVQSPMVMVSASGSAGQPVMVQAGPSATGLPPQQAEMSPTYAGHGQYPRLNEEVRPTKRNYNINKNGLKTRSSQPKQRQLQRQINQARKGACGSVNIDLILLRSVGGFLTSHRAL